VKLPALALVLATATAAIHASAQSSQTPEETTVCDIVNHPSQFIGKTVKVRAQIWRDVDHRGQFWLNESSIEVGKVCRFLPAGLDGPADLFGQTAFATFLGKVLSVSPIHQSQIASPTGSKSRISLVVEDLSDVHSEGGIQTGPIPILQLYDQQTASFIRTQN
jgi:hypothetical protein